MAMDRSFLIVGRDAACCNRGESITPPERGKERDAMPGSYEQAEWLEWSGLPRALNAARAGAWGVFKKIVELDCRAGRRPGVVEIPLEHLAERCGLDVEQVEKIIETLRRKKYLRVFLPEHPGEAALLEIRVPVATPIPAEEVARRNPDPHVRDPHNFRYARAVETPSADLKKVQDVVDLYLNHVSQRMNTFVIEQIEMIARRFEMAVIDRTMRRASEHNIRQIGWIVRELIREEKRPKK
jgi:hypothetical protein